LIFSDDEVRHEFYQLPLSIQVVYEKIALMFAEQKLFITVESIRGLEVGLTISDKL
jgi:hypothetical protein